jgi:3-oxoacyl-[acyl-carrier-protein] synthase II
MSLQRVVITGLGIVAGGCQGVESFWERLFSGVSAVGPLTAASLTDSGCRVAAEIKSVQQWPLGISQKQLRYMDPVSIYGLMAAKEGMKVAGLGPAGEMEADDIGVSVGLSFGSLSANRYEEKFNISLAAVTSYFGSIIGSITIPLRLSGPSHTFMSFDVAGTDAIGYAFELIRHGKARAMLAGAADSPLNPFVMDQLDRAGFLSHGTGEPRLVWRSSGGSCDGIVPGEGGAMAVLESLESASKRGASIYAEVLGYSTESYGEGAEGMGRLLKQANVAPDRVDCVVAGGTGYAPVDSQEVEALRAVFGERPRPAVTHIVRAVGHSFAAHGAMQAITSALIVKEQSIPPVGHLDESEDCCGLNQVRPPGASGPVRVLLQNTIGLSGKSSFLLFGQYE